MIVIYSAYYGDRKEFNTLEEAETELQECSPDQGKIVLHLYKDGEIWDHNGEPIGYDSNIAAPNVVSRYESPK